MENNTIYERILKSLYKDALSAAIEHVHDANEFNIHLLYAAKIGVFLGFSTAKTIETVDTGVHIGEEG